MPKEENQIHANKLLALAEVYGTSINELPLISLSIYASSKSEVIAAIRAIGGKFVKRDGGSFMYYDSQKIPGVSVSIWRESVCRLIKTYECEPLFSPEEEKEIMDVANA